MTAVVFSVSTARCIPATPSVSSSITLGQNSQWPQRSNRYRHATVGSSAPRQRQHTCLYSKFTETNSANKFQHFNHILNSKQYRKPLYSSAPHSIRSLQTTNANIYFKLNFFFHRVNPSSRYRSEHSLSNLTFFQRFDSVTADTQLQQRCR